MGLNLKSRKIIFVHGIFGWGSGELPLSYWGDALKQFEGSRFQVHEVKCGPISSFQDRACEVYAQIKGGDFHYKPIQGGGPAGAKRATVARNERQHVAPDALLPDWSADNPVILVGHSAGAHTCLALQRLLKEDFFGVGSNADWIEAVICISGVLNGSTLAYMFGCDPATGVLKHNPNRLIDAAVGIANLIPVPHDAGIELWLDQWVNRSAFVSGKDNLAYDLTLSGCHAANAAFSSHPNTYYLSVVTSMPPTPTLFGIPIPFRGSGINALLQPAATYQAKTVNFTAGAFPLPDWDTAPDLRMDAWRENDGAVSAISQRFPFTAHPEPVGQGGFFAGVPIQRGRWYFEKVEDVVGSRLDHLDPGFGAKIKPSAGEAHRQLYRKLAARL